MRIYLRNNESKSNFTTTGLIWSNWDDHDYKISFNLSSIEMNYEVVSINNSDTFVNRLNFMINNNRYQYSIYLSKHVERYVIESW